jgi:hypothetical protein
MAEELRQRFGLHDAVLVADRRIFSADNVVALAESGQRYILGTALPSADRSELALDLAQLAGLPRPRDVKAEWQWREVEIIPGLRWTSFRGSRHPELSESARHSRGR